MPITILCPNGHKLTCPDSLAGKAGKCPHCQAKFRIPEKSGGPQIGPAGGAPQIQVKTGGSGAIAAPVVTTTSAPPAAAADAPLAEPVVEAAASETKSGSPIRSLDAAGAAEPTADEVVFMCPEGHHLCGPAALVDQPGECPVCHEKFIVPSPEDIVEPQEPEINLSALLATAEAPQGFSFGGGDEGSAKGIGALFAELWKYRALGSAVEVHLAEGGVLVPNGFAVESAGLSHGVFTLAEPNGAATLAVIAWSSIQRVNVRGLYSLPRGVEFDVPQ
jgi:hypothetical protein